MKYRPLFILSLMTAILPMLTGTLIFWSWFYYPEFNNLELWGINTIIISVPICIIGLALLLIVRNKNIEDKKSKKLASRTILITLGNIPLAIFYFWFASYILDTQRITIVNNSENDIQDVSLFGAGSNAKISKIKKGESKTVWLHMTKVGMVSMKYSQDSRIDTVSLTGYTGPAMGGHRIKYNIRCTEEDYKNKFGK